MKSGIHPKYNHILYVDASTGTEWQGRSTMTSGEKRDIDGVEHHVVRLDISSYSHPFFTGKQRLVDSEGRIDRWRRKYAEAAEKQKAVAAEMKKATEAKAPEAEA